MENLDQEMQQSQQAEQSQQVEQSQQASHTPQEAASPEAASASDGPALSLSDLAVEKVRETMLKEGMEDGGLRISVVGGGCSGFQYSLGIDATAREDDIVVEQAGVKLFVDPTSHQYVHGTMLDYVSGLHGAGFRFVNPNATRTCGCGSSFSV